MTMNLKPLQKLQQKSPKHFRTAAEKGAIQFLTWANNGSKNETRKPPIRWGVLRGSSSSFVGNKFLSVFPINVKTGALEQPTPAKSYSGKDLVLTWCWNTDYAAKMHEHQGGWGKFTLQDGDAGNKWIERHLRRDKNDLMKMIAIEFKKAAGM